MSKSIFILYGQQKIVSRISSMMCAYLSIITFLRMRKPKNIIVDALGIQKEHLHALISLRSDQNIDDVAKLLKGESSHWINSENLINPKFSWQRGYGAFSISPSHVDAVKIYINNQDEHHRKKTYVEEVTELLTKYGLTPEEIAIVEGKN
jgi:putative transposase